MPQLYRQGTTLPLGVQEGVIKILEACTLTDAEREAGPALWETWSCPWDTL